MTARQKDNIVYGTIALGSVVFLAWVIPAYTPPYPGYGVPTDLLPNVSVGIILALSVLALVRNFMIQAAARRGVVKQDKPENLAQVDRVNLWHLAKFLAPCILLMPAMIWAGFIPAGVAFMLAMQWLCGQRKPSTLALVAIIPVGVMYLAMRYGLGAPMP